MSFDGEPVVAASGDGRLELFVVGRDGGLWHAWQAQWSNSSDWYGWCDMGLPEVLGRRRPESIATGPSRWPRGTNPRS